jgi:hypothetical protein
MQGAFLQDLVEEVGQQNDAHGNCSTMKAEKRQRRYMQQVDIGQGSTCVLTCTPPGEHLPDGTVPPVEDKQPAIECPTLQTAADKKEVQGIHFARQQ